MFSHQVSTTLQWLLGYPIVRERGNRWEHSNKNFQNEAGREGQHCTNIYAFTGNSSHEMSKMQENGLHTGKIYNETLILENKLKWGSIIKERQNISFQCTPILSKRKNHNVG